MLFSHQLHTMVLLFAAAYCAIQVLTDLILAYRVHYLFGSHPNFGSSSLLPDCSPQTVPGRNVLEQLILSCFVVQRLVYCAHSLLSLRLSTLLRLSTTRTCKSSHYALSSMTGEMHGKNVEVKLHIMVWPNPHVQCNAHTKEALLPLHCQLPSQPRASLVFWRCSELSPVKLTENQPVRQTRCQITKENYLFMRSG